MPNFKFEYLPEDNIQKADFIAAKTAGIFDASLSRQPNLLKSHGKLVYHLFRVIPPVTRCLWVWVFLKMLKDTNLVILTSEGENFLTELDIHLNDKKVETKQMYERVE